MGTVSGKMNRGADFSALPEDIIAKILSMTTPRDACRLPLVSKLFRSLVDSDAVWSRFLPFDYKSIIARADISYTTLIIPSMKKELYFLLCSTPIVIDGGKKCFSLDKLSGKIIYGIAAKELKIQWGDSPQFWSWLCWCLSRFIVVATLLHSCWIDIRGKINTEILSPQTTYAAYLVCRFREAYGFNNTSLEASVGISGGESCKQILYLNVDEEQKWWWRQIVQWCFRLFRRSLAAHLLASQSYMARERNDYYPKRRGDGWLEVELGEYFNEGGANGEVEMSLIEVDHLHFKGGLIIQGMEIRPKESNK